MKIAGSILAAMIAVVSCNAELLGSVKPQKLTFKIVGVTEKIQKSGFSANRDVFVARAVDKKGHADWIKVEYRYLGYEREFPDEMLSSGMAHTFVAVRDYSCDESLQSLRTKYVIDATGKLIPVDVLRYTGHDITLTFPAEQQLPCFVVHPKTYRGSQQIRARRAATQGMQGE